jgi:hypothetical protein
MNMVFDEPFRPTLVRDVKPHRQLVVREADVCVVKVADADAELSAKMSTQYFRDVSGECLEVEVIQLS